MNKRKRFRQLLWVLIPVLVAGCMVYGQVRTVSLGALLPEDNFSAAELEQMREEDLDGDIRFVAPAVEEILTLLRNTRVKAGPEKRDIENRAFRISLYREGSWPTVLYVAPSGRVAVAVDMAFDHWEYYQGGRELYEALEALAQTLEIQDP